MGELAFSIVIPYKQRLRNLRIVLSSLAEQTLPGSRFEVVVGAMEYAEEYLELCREFAGRLNLVTVMADGEWNCSRARNMALRQAAGEVIVLLDADVALPERCLESLYDRYFATGQNVCVLGQLIGRDGLTDVEEADLPEQTHHRERLAELDAASGLRGDKRWRFDPVVLPWTIVWTGFVALPAAAVRRHDLYFDENFWGWGGEDLEWGYRVGASGTPIVRGEDVYGLHLPHARNVAANFRTCGVNKDYFLAKWPVLEVELYRAYECWEANRRYDEARSEVAGATGDSSLRLGVARGTVDGADTLLIGAVLDEQGRIHDGEHDALFDAGAPDVVLPLVGLALPFDEHSVSECLLLPPVLRLGAPYRETVLREAERVARRVVTPV
jgi:glycosyltransferase involved in cell wall biosynthesis